ncbi:hypothetical protein ACIQYS_02310 [Psychrobacillus sp. NPDC096426]|uniref:hypothetical protein n=1 Tax=Psychrobacillus sp. NPDC096426 TaxID=3364491 RepID=UPI0038253328
MNKYFLSFAVIFFGISILFSAYILSQALKEIAYNQQPDNTTINEDTSEWEMIVVNENNIILFNRYTGDYWTKSINRNEGNTEWEKGLLPFNF